MKALRGHDWQLSDAGRGYRVSDDFDFDESERTATSFRQELLSALAVAGLALVAFALL
jgi:hypothetical protein